MKTLSGTSRDFTAAKSLSRRAQIVVLSILLLVSVNSGWSSVVPLIALTDTNNPQSTIATFSLTESNLQFDTVLAGFRDVEFSIMCSSNGVAVGGVVWRFPRLLLQTVLSELTPAPRVEQIATEMVFWSPPTNQIELTAEQVALFRDGFGIIQFFWLGSGPTTAFIRQVDSDNDGVPDGDDQCPGTMPGSLVDADGCSIDQLAPCDGLWRNHGEFVNAFKAVTSHFLRSGLINAKQARQLNAAAAQSGCGN